jgi:hypothetical protein
MTSMRTSIHGRRLGLGPDDELLSNEIRLGSPAVDVAITVAASATSPRAVTLQVKNARGENVAEATPLKLILFLDAAQVAFAVTGGSTGIAASVGIVQAIIAKKQFQAVTDANGAMTLSWTDTAHEVAFLGVQLPNGRIVMSGALTTA